MAAGAGALFATGICIASKVRGGTNDPLNHFVGGLAAGSSFGVAGELKWCLIHLLYKNEIVFPWNVQKYPIVKKKKEIAQNKRSA